MCNIEYILILISILILIENIKQITQKLINKRMRRHKLQISQNSLILDTTIIDNTKLNEDLIRMGQQLCGSNTSKSSTPSMIQSRVNHRRKSGQLGTHDFSNNFLNKNKLGLKKVLRDQKVKGIVNNFLIKLKRNIINSPPINYQPYDKQQDDGFLQRTGFTIPIWFQLIHSIISIFFILIMVFLYPLAIIFTNFMQEQISNLQTACVIFYALQVIINFISIKTIQGRKISVLKDIFIDYCRRKFSIDLLCIIILIIDASINNQQTKYFRMCVLLKIKQCLDKLQRIENLLINNFYKQQYWALAKVFLVNFAFAHCLAILLIAMTKLCPQNNWLTKLRAQYSPWYQIYSWAFYWGSTIMLTVGFGDLSATNYKQAICLTLIQTVSCILLAYNINCVGNLISNIRAQDIEKNKNFKIIRRLTQENKIKEEISSKVCNYVDQADKIKKKFGFQEEKEFVSKLPSQLKADFFKQSNIKIFQDLRFFSSFTQKTLLILAEQVQAKIAHPEQIIFKSQGKPKFIILKNGKVGYCTKINGSKFDNCVIDLVKIQKDNKPMVLYLNFLAPNFKQSKFQIKSLKYSIIYKISLIDFVQMIKSSILDFQSFCQARDKSQHITDLYQVITCKYCTTKHIIEGKQVNTIIKHSLMRCPKLHFMPIQQHAVYKYLQLVKNGKCQRGDRRVINYKLKKFIPLKLRKHFSKLEEQLYPGNISKTMKTTTYKQYLPQQVSQYKGTCIQVSYRDRATFDENRLVHKIQSKLCEQMYKMLEKQIIDEEKFWNLELDLAHNFKFYFYRFNPSELHVQLGTKKNKNHRSQYLTTNNLLTAIKTMKSKPGTEKFI